MKIQGGKSINLNLKVSFSLTKKKKNPVQGHIQTLLQNVDIFVYPIILLKEK